MVEVGIAGLSASTADWAQPSPADVTRLRRDNGDTKLWQQKLQVSLSGWCWCCWWDERCDDGLWCYQVSLRVEYRRGVRAEWVQVPRGAPPACLLLHQHWGHVVRGGSGPCLTFIIIYDPQVFQSEETNTIDKIALGQFVVALENTGLRRQ